MTFVRNAVMLLACALGPGVSNAASDWITPSEIRYTYNAHENESAKLCEIILDLRSPASPELVQFTAFAGLSKQDGSIAVGFIMGAAKQSPTRQFQPFGLSHAAFMSSTFSSADSMDYEMYDAAGTAILATADPTNGGEFLHSFVRGNFQLTLKSRAPEHLERTYQVSPGPPVDVRGSFGDCLEKLMPSAAGGASARSV